MSATLEFQLLSLAGLIIHYTKEWAIANSQGKKYDFKKAIPMAILSAVTGAILIYLRDDFKDIYPITGLSAVILGYIGNSAFFSVVDVKKPKFATDETKSDQP